MGSGREELRWPWPRSLLLISSVVAIVATTGWLMAEARALSGTWTGLGLIVSGTRFGRVTALRLGLLALSTITALVLPARRSLWLAETLIGGAAVATFAWTGHGTLDSGAAGRLHLGADVLHLLSAGIWIGALLPLSMLILRSRHGQSATDARQVAHGLARFSVIGPTVVATLVATGLINSWLLVGPQHWHALFNTPYGLALTAKVMLFGLMLVFAATHRYHATPALQQAIARGTERGPVLQRLRGTILAETALALLVLTAVAVLGMLEPPVAAA